MTVKACASRAELVPGCGLILPHRVLEGTNVAVEFPTNARLQAKVLQITDDGLWLDVEGKELAFRPWSEGDDSLPRWAGAGSEWTQEHLDRSSDGLGPSERS